MNILRKAFVCIKRNLVKTLMLFLIVFILGNVVLGSIAIHKAIANTKQYMFGKINPVVSVEIDNSKISEHNTAHPENPVGDFERLSLDTIKQIGSLPYIKSYEYSLLEWMESKEMKQYSDPKFESFSSTIEGYSAFELRGCQDPEVFDIKADRIKLIDGRTFTQDKINHLKYTMIISKDLAETNQLDVGSMVNMAELVYDDFSNIVKKQAYTFEIIGIFEPVKTAEEYSQIDPHSRDFKAYLLKNEIYTSNTVVKTLEDFYLTELYKDDPVSLMKATSSDRIHVNCYILNSALDMRQFREDVTLLLPNEWYRIADTVQGLEQLMAPMESIDWISTVILMAGIGASVVILSLLITLFLRDRRQEIGIYLSLGEKKHKIVTQILLEVLAIAMVALTLSLLSGGKLSEVISDKVMNDQIVDIELVPELVASNIARAGYETIMTADDVLAAYKTPFNSQIILLFYAVWISTILVSTVVPMWYINRLNPKGILM